MKLFKRKKTISSFNNEFKIDGKFVQGQNVNITNSKIIIDKDSELIIEDNVIINGFDIRINGGKINIGNNSILERNNQLLQPSIIINKGELILSDHVRLRSKILIRFNGKCKIGRYTAVNEGTEIRCDEEINIGKFVMISYQCNIYDTNTHCIFPFEKRREMTVRDYPNIGAEFDRPKTKPVNIEDDCWIGKRATILKGVKMEQGAILGIDSVLTSNLTKFSTAVGNPAKIVKA